MKPPTDGALDFASVSVGAGFGEAAAQESFLRLRRGPDFRFVACLCVIAEPKFVY